MPNDESNFDTMRLIAGASASEEFSLEEIMEEFSPEIQKPPEDTGASSEIASFSEEKEDAPSPKPDSELEHEAVLFPEETTDSAPEFQVQSESEIANAIAQAVAAAVELSGPEIINVPTDSSEKNPQSNAEIEAEAVPDRSDAKQSEASAPHAPEPPEVASGTNPAQSASHPTPKLTDTKAEPTPIAVPNVHTAGQTTEVPVSKPGAKQKKIPKSNVRVGTMELLGMMFGDIQTRQRQDLPGSNASLKSAEQHQAWLSKICQVMSPVRYVILLLMALSLAGRKYSWMLLGFLGSSTGVTVSLVLALVAMLSSWHCVYRAVKDAFYLRFSFESLLLLTTLLSMAEAAIYQNTQTLLPLLVMGWCFAGTADLMASKGKLRALRTVIMGKNRIGVRIARDKWEHTDCIGKAPASTAGFVRHQQIPDAWHSVWTVYGMLLLILALIVSAYLSAKTAGSYLTILVTLLTVAMPVGGALCCARPFELLSRALGNGGAVAGWFGMKALSGKKAMLIYDRDLFPKGTITHKGVKVYGNQTPELLVSYGASLVLRADNGLSEPFRRLLRETGGQIWHVSYFQVNEGGLLGRINGVLVAVGTYNFMQLMGAMPPRDAPKGGIFIALNGSVAGLFAIKYRVKSGAIRGFRRIVRDRTLTALAATKNLCVNPAFVKKWFQVSVGAVVCPKIETRQNLAQPSLFAQGTTCGYVTGDGIENYSRLVAGARMGCRMGRFLSALSVLGSICLWLLTVLDISAGHTIIGGARLLLIQLLLWLLTEAAARFSVK